jgi:Flp pilus assembly protein TadB
MDATDAAELISEIREERAEHEADETFRNRAALLIAIMAMLLAVGSLGGGNVAEDMIHNNIKASDTWAFYQAKNVRQTSYRLALDQMRVQLASPALSPQARTELEGTIAKYEQTIARYDDEPDPAAPADSLRGEGKKQLSAQARGYERLRERAGAQDSNFDYSEVALQLGLVLGSVAILSLSRAILYFAATLGAIGLLLMVNGFLLLFPLPF